MCGSSHTPEHALHKDMRAVKRSISSEKEQEQEQEQLEKEPATCTKFQISGRFLARVSQQLKEIVYACFWHVCAYVCVFVCVCGTNYLVL